MARFRLRRTGIEQGSTLRGGDTLRGDDSPLSGADAEAQADATADLATQINMAADAQAQADATADLDVRIALAADAQAQADATASLTDYITPVPVAHDYRKYQQFLRGPLSGVVYRFGSVKAYRGGAWHTANIREFSAPQENALDEFGIQQGGGFSVELISNEDVTVDLGGVGAALRNQTCELELVTQFYKYDGTLIQETTHVRRAVVKRSVQKKNVLVIELEDVDRSALERVYPFQTFTVEDWPEIFVDHVGRRVCVGIGTVVRVPLTWVQKTGSFRYAGPKVALGPATLLTVYRGDQDGRGAIVDPSEYTTGTMAAAVTVGLTVNTVNFVGEQIDFSGRPYILEADYLLPGARTPAEVIALLLSDFGIATDAQSFAEAAAYDMSNGFAVDVLVGPEGGRTGNAILEDLLRAGRGWLSQVSTGEWKLVQDRPRVPIIEYNARASQVDVTAYEDSEIQKTVRIEYRPRRAGFEEYIGSLERTTSGPAGELLIKMPYVRDHTVADRLASYHQKRLASLRRATAMMHAVQLNVGDVLTIIEPLLYAGKRHFMIEALSRPADANEVKLREFNSTIYDYTPGTLPAGATNVYGPDYSFTPPAAPTGLTVVSQGTSADTDGKLTAFAKIRAIPPAVNWSLLMVLVTDTTTNEVYLGQLLENAGNYESVVSGLRPNRTHSVVAWAVNNNNVDGAVTVAVPFTSATYSTGPSAPAGVNVSQTHSFEIQLKWNRVNDVAGAPKIRHYVPFLKTAAGAFVAQDPIAGHILKIPNIVHGTAYQLKVRSVDMNDNESVDSSTVSITPQKKIDDSHVIGGGISGPSISDSSINQGRGFTGVSSQSGSIFTAVSVGGDRFMFLPGLGVDIDAYPTYWGVVPSGGGNNDQGMVYLINQGLQDGSQNYSAFWRTFLE
jgi:hypothetical protein